MPDSPSWATSEATRRSMKGNRGRDTGPELAVRRIIHARGLRYQVDARPLPELNRRADLVFSRVKVAVFIDGCFWHGCPAHHTVAKANASYWAEKIANNRRRDLDTAEQLREQGWLVLRFWEHQPASEVADVIVGAVKERGTSGGHCAKRTR
ncbi:very short patch repair endonuclease [Mumia sp. zg.B53]|uniref:very short patch repair endonuclease n=1 Tax=Mumia sp. zg.B53 TaxID=2855449 RepID=UPI001C6E035E|nr:very short patch repair endonuclease [Mumia sp. zg.B53]MBW9213227.1 very short patch repair endonuclease [Mumia sp. zg.B53]